MEESITNYNNKKILPTTFLIMITRGNEEDGVLASLAFSIALSLKSYDIEVIVYLTGAGIYWGMKDSMLPTVEGFGPLEDLIASFLEQEGKIYMCSTCLNSGVCSTHTIPRAKIEIAGYSSIVPFLLHGKSIVF